MLHVAKATRGRGRNLQEKDARVEWRDTALVKAKATESSVGTQQHCSANRADADANADAVLSARTGIG
jgi:hypothetical protein